MTREDAMRRVRKLLDRTVERGATPAEAAGCAAKAKEILDEFQLSLLDVEARQYREDVVEEELENGAKRTSKWVKHMLNVLCDAYDCQAIRRRNGKEDPWRRVVIGHASDVCVVRYLFAYLSGTLSEAATQHGRLLNRVGNALTSFRNDYLFGAAEAIRGRIGKQARKAQTGSCTALVSVKDAAVTAWIAREIGKVRTVTQPTRTNPDAYLAGYAKGKTVPIRQDVGSSDAAPALTV